jgi:hypothetical protein
MNVNLLIVRYMAQTVPGLGTFEGLILQWPWWSLDTACRRGVLLWFRAVK